MTNTDTKQLAKLRERCCQQSDAASRFGDRKQAEEWDGYVRLIDRMTRPSLSRAAQQEQH